MIERVALSGGQSGSECVEYSKFINDEQLYFYPYRDVLVQ